MSARTVRLSRQQIQDRLPGRDRLGETVLAKAGLQRDAQRLVDRGAKILWPHRLLFHIGADAVGFAVNRAAANAAAGQQGGEAVRPVQTTGLPLRLYAWRAAELADDHDQSPLQQAAVVE